MRNDHVATLPLVHWPTRSHTGIGDLRRGATYSPVLGRWVTLNDYFHLTDRPYETFRPDPDSYVSPYLAQAAASRDPEPISRLARHHRLRARFDAIEWARAMALAISAAATGSPPHHAGDGQRRRIGEHREPDRDRPTWRRGVRARRDWSRSGPDSSDAGDPDRPARSVPEQAARDTW